ncbi:MAG: helix-turn-helix transcriptional regulator [Bacteroidia bacterium]
MEEFNLIFANKLQELRKEHNVKQEVLAKELKFTQQAYSKLERGASNFTPQILKKICNYFGVSASTFLNTGSQTRISNSPQANTQNSFNNEFKLVEEVIKSKDEVILTQKELIEQLKNTIQLNK